MPLCHQLQTVDLVRRLDLPVVMVCGLRLGCISHSILTAEAILQDGVTLVGWVANRVDPHYTRVDETIDTIQSAIKVPLLASLDYDNGPNMHQVTLTTDTSTLDNWITSHQPRPA